jgi:sugar/nucleoside kinase (ribokinase family)
MPKVLVAGNCIVDHCFRIPQRFEHDQKMFAHSVASYAGGQAANVAHTLRQMGSDVEFCGVFGKDVGATISLESLERIGVGITFSQQIDAPNQSAIIIVDNTGGRTIVMHRSEQLVFDTALLDPFSFEGYDGLYIDGYELEASTILAEQANRQGVPVYADMEFVSSEGLAILSLVDHLIAPQSVLIEIAQKKELAECLSSIKLEFRLRSIVATRAEKGCMGLMGDELLSISAPRLEVVDTTGAGDAFHAAYVYQSVSNKPFSDCLKAAVKVASEKCLYPGARIPEGVIQKGGHNEKCH